jgi:hypothetical protein
VIIENKFFLSFKNKIIYTVFSIFKTFKNMYTKMYRHSGMDTTNDGRSVVLGMGDGSMTTLTIADPAKDGTKVVIICNFEEYAAQSLIPYYGGLECACSSLLCLFRPFCNLRDARDCIFKLLRAQESILMKDCSKIPILGSFESCRGKQARYQLSYPSPCLATYLSNIMNFRR